jgi:hypothetical protein
VAEISVRAARGDVCDFCSSPDPRFDEASPDFEVKLPEGLAGRSKGAWASCQTCHDLIAQRDWQGLEKRALKAMQRKYPGAPREDVARAVRELQLRFRAHRS